MTVEERKKEIMHYLPIAAKRMSECITDEAPQTGRFTGLSISFDLSESRNIASLVYQFDELRKGDQRVLSLGLKRAGSSYMIRTHIFKGTNEETQRFLHFTQEQLEEFTDSLLEMSDNADDRDDRFIH